MKLPTAVQETRRRIWRTPCQASTSARPASHIWPRWPRKLGPRVWIDGLLTTPTDDAARSRPKAKSSGRRSAASARPSRAATSSCRGTKRQATACETKSTGCRWTGAGGAAGTRSNPTPSLCEPRGLEDTDQGDVESRGHPLWVETPSFAPI